ncbi:Protein of unknown function (DUF1364) [Frateuria aurantia DSM 6220]|uniref:Uncharacterized protein n=2 Tax=Frateuria aurantia TaxID=81475 RepID=H8L2H8_FRAAD|nr:Protein of unknown function (DUF1364) [Frateuria aurantia DSM 6220]
MSKARQLAKGQPCMIGIAGTCNGDPETTVFARYPMDVYFDIEMSSDDELGAWACSACNAVLVRRPPILEEFFLQLRLFHAEGVLRTQHAIREMDR